MPNKKTYIIFTISLFATLLMLGVLIFVFLQVKTKNEQASVISQQISRKITEGENVETLRNVIEDTKEKRQQLKSYVVDESRIDEFVGQIESEGELIGLPITINSVALSPTKKNVLAVSFSGSGSFDKVMKMVSLVEYSPYQIHINNLALNKYTKSLGDAKKEIIITEWDFQVDFEVVSDNSFK